MCGGSLRLCVRAARYQFVWNSSRFNCERAHVRDSGPRPPTSRECCKSRGRMSSLRACRRARTRPPARARSTRRGGTRTRGIRHATYLMPTPWLVRHRSVGRCRRRWYRLVALLHLRSCRRRRVSACRRRSLCGRGANWSPVLQRTETDTSNCKLISRRIESRFSTLSVAHQQRIHRNSHRISYITIYPRRRIKSFQRYRYSSSSIDKFDYVDLEMLSLFILIYFSTWKNTVNCQGSGWWKERERRILFRIWSSF